MNIFFFSIHREEINNIHLIQINIFVNMITNIFANVITIFYFIFTPTLHYLHIACKHRVKKKSVKTMKPAERNNI